MKKCGHCNSSILFGGTQWSVWDFCNDQCATKCRISLTEKFFSPADIEKQVYEIHKAKCLVCGNDGPNDVYLSKKITGMILAVEFSELKHVCCYKCGRKKKLSALLHCLLLGWWSPKAAIGNILLYIPYNLIGIPLTRKTTHPSKALANSVKELIAINNTANFIKG